MARQVDDSRQQWIPCGVSPGMFSDERVVEINDRTFFVNEKSVRSVEGRDEVEVTIVERDGQKWAVLPTSAREMVPLEDWWKDA